MLLSETDMISEETMQHPPIVEYVAPQAHERGRQKATVARHIGMAKTNSVNLWQVESISIRSPQAISPQRAKC